MRSGPVPPRPGDEDHGLHLPPTLLRLRHVWTAVAGKDPISGLPAVAVFFYLMILSLYTTSKNYN